METAAVRPMALLILLCVSSGTAVAQSPQSSAEAEQLFRDGKRLMTAGDYAQACEAFAGSMRKEPLPTTAVNLADCREKNQQYASAWGAFLDAARLTRSRPDLDALRTLAEDRARALEPRLSHLVITIADDARVDGLVIARNGEPVEPATWNRAIPVDGGTYLIEGAAPTYEPWSATVKVGAAQDHQSVVVPRLVPATTGAAAGPTDASSPPLLTGGRKAALGLWSAGLLALGAGLALEIRSGRTYDDAQTAATSAERHNLTDTANRERMWATIAAGVGATAVGVGVYLWIRGKPSAGDRITLRPQLDDHGFAALLIGQF